jgi:hypothetical protein
LELPVDLLILAALENQINERNAHRIRAKITSEGANGGSTKEAIQKLFQRPGKKRSHVIPSILASAGGVAISSKEIEQNLTGNYPGEIQLGQWLAGKMEEAVDHVWKVHLERNIDLGTAAFLVGMEEHFQPRSEGEIRGDQSEFDEGEQKPSEPRSEVRASDSKEKPKPKRSEIREISLKRLPESQRLTVLQFAERNQKLGGAGWEGIRRVVQEFTPEIISLAAYETDAFSVLLSLFLPKAQAEVMDPTGPLAAYPLRIQQRFQRAEKEVLGLNSDRGYAYVLGPEFALEDGGLAFIRTVFGDSPAVVVIRNDKDRAFVENFNRRLVEAKRPVILIAEDIGDARQKLREFVTHRGGVRAAAFTYQGIVNTTEPLAEALKETLRDQVVLVTPQIFERFAEVAGLESLVEELRAQFQISKSA